MRKNYDYIVVGAGPAGVFFCIEMLRKKPGVSILLLDQGSRVEARNCPKKVTGKCMKCKFCSVTCGVAGAGAFSDGKLSLYNKEDDDFYVGGNLHKYAGVEETKRLIDYTDSIYLEFGATKEVKGTSHKVEVARIRKKAEENHISLVNIPIRHLGTDNSPKIYENMEKYLEDSGVVISTKSQVTDFIIEDGKINGVEYVCENIKHKVYSTTVISAVGRVGAKWLLDMCQKHQIKSVPGPIDIGIRYELPDYIMKDVNKYMYEGKFFGKPLPFNDKVRTFCQNPSGYVSEEGYDGGLMLVNGHSYSNPKMSSYNTNLALLVTLEIKGINPIEYVGHIVKNMNDLANGGILLQRFGDLKNGKRTWQEELNRNSVKPTLSAVAGDMSLAMPYRVVKNIIGFIEQMEAVIPGFANPDNLMYATEAKFYSNKVKLSKTFETSIKGLYAIGDGCGLTRGLMMASASGVKLARNLCDI